MEQKIFHQVYTKCKRFTFYMCWCCRYFESSIRLVCHAKRTLFDLLSRRINNRSKNIYIMSSYQHCDDMKCVHVHIVHPPYTVCYTVAIMFYLYPFIVIRYSNKFRQMRWWQFFRSLEFKREKKRKNSNIIAIKINNFTAVEPK